MKIALINPKVSKPSGRDQFSAHILGPLLKFRPFKKMSFGLPLALPTIAAYTPPGCDIDIIDEEIEEIDFSVKYDLVGITAMTYKAARAYRLAGEFRKRGAKTVLGGIHPTMKPREASLYADAVAVGESDFLWEDIVLDARKNRLKRFYRSESYPDINSLETPRFSLMKRDRYVATFLQTTRGCPFNCKFCTANKISGRILRKKRAERVLAELDSLLKLRKKRFSALDARDGETKPMMGNVIFIDDNFSHDREHAFSVSQALRRYQDEREIILLWNTLANFRIGFDEALLRSMADSNCRKLIIGFENTDDLFLKEMRKEINKPRLYAEAVSNIHAANIQVLYSTIIGDGRTGGESVKKTMEFSEKSGIVHILPNILTPYPGSEIEREMKEEKRILLEGYDNYNTRTVVFLPEKMSPIKLQEIFVDFCDKALSFSNIRKRALKWISNSKDPLRLSLKDRAFLSAVFPFFALIALFQGKMRPSLFASLLFLYPFYLLFSGKLWVVDVFTSVMDYDNFVKEEKKRLGILRKTYEKLCKTFRRPGPEN